MTPRRPPRAIAGPTIERPRPAGIFPYGGTDGAIAAGYATPIEAVSAYVAAITDPARLPEGSRSRPRSPRRPSGRRTPIGSSCGSRSHTPDDTGDGYATVQRLRDDPAVWQVTAAAVVGEETSDVQIVDGTLTGSIATAAGGSTTLYAYDLTSGDVLDSTTVNGVEPPVGADAASISFSLDVGATTQVGLRYWNTVAPAGGNTPTSPITSSGATPTATARPVPRSPTRPR